VTLCKVTSAARQQPEEESKHGTDLRFQRNRVCACVDDPAFVQALLDEAITLFVSSEPYLAKLIQRGLVNATVGFEALAQEMHKPAESLHRMLSQLGNPTMNNISAVFAAIKRATNADVRAQILVA
jgi:DNA-binding phage protein